MESTDARDELDKIIKSPMDDDEIKKYLPNVPVLSYTELTEKTLDEILPDKNTYCIILYQSSPHSGHWVALLRYDNLYEYFDSYGNVIDEPLSWVPLSMNKLTICIALCKSP